MDEMYKQIPLRLRFWKGRRTRMQLMYVVEQESGNELGYAC